MKTIHVILFVLLAVFCSTGRAADVVFNLKDFLQTVQPLQKRTALIEPLSTTRANTASNTVILSERRFFNTGTNGTFTTTNMMEGVYRVSVYGLNYTSVFRVNIPDTNGTLQASDLLMSGNPYAIETEDGQTLELE